MLTQNNLTSRITYVVSPRRKLSRALLISVTHVKLVVQLEGQLAVVPDWSRVRRHTGPVVRPSTDARRAGRTMSIWEKLLDDLMVVEVGTNIVAS